MSARVAVVHLDRPGARGNTRRVRGWMELIAAAGATAVPIDVLTDGRANAWTRGGRALDVARGIAVPETLAWSLAPVARELREVDAAVFVTARAWHPRLAGVVDVGVLDYVDRLSVSYEGRARLARRQPRRAMFDALAASHRRVECGATPGSIERVAAGWADAAALAASWIPICVEPQAAVDPDRADHDLLFVGSLGYPPNRAAVLRLGRLWPRLRARRPGISLLVAGSAPPPDLRVLVAANGWTLAEDFADLRDVHERARVAVAPLTAASGIQIKVLEAAAAGVAQVVSPVATAGFAPGMPVPVARSDDDFVEMVVGLLADPDARLRAAAAARAHVIDRYSTTRWSSEVARVLHLPHVGGLDTPADAA